MISTECFSREYIQSQRDALGSGDLIIIEKSICALALLGHLAETELPFIFKGGTSLLLHLPRIRRLSIDIDIMCSATDGKLDSVVDSISSLPPFVRAEENDRGARGLPARRHFKFFYPSAVTGKEEYVLLDVVQENDCKLECVEKPIRTEFIQVEREVQVRVPTVEALLGDKLTAFAPHTLGVPFQTKKGNSMTMQVAKQLFDVGELFSEVKDLEAVKRAYLESYKIESTYREGFFSLEGTLNDTKNVALQLCVNGTRGGTPDTEIIEPMLDGIKRLKNHLVRDQFGPNLEVKVAAAKAHLLASYILGEVDLSEEQLSFIISDRLDFIREASILEPQHLNRLKKTVPEAFYYLVLGLGA